MNDDIGWLDGHFPFLTVSLSGDSHLINLTIPAEPVPAGGSDLRPGAPRGRESAVNREPLSEAHAKDLA